MQRSFTPDSVKCRDLFDGEEDLYKIPRYQRPYSWEEQHINQLIDDLYESWSDDQDSPYFLGSVILVKEDDGNRFNILDGQQRLTSLTIFYAVFKDHFEEHLNERNSNRVKGRVIERDLDKARLRTDKQADLEKSVLKSARLDEENRYTTVAEHIVNRIEEKFNEQTELLNDFFEYVDQNVELIRITSDDLAHAVRLFQTINTRGKDLTVSDLTKSYLLSNLEDEEDKDDVIEVWQDITSEVDDDYDELDDILGMYRLYLQEAKAQESVYEELKQEFEGLDPKDIVLDIRGFVEKYKELENASDRWIFILDNLTHELYWKTILISAKKEDVGYYDDLKEELVGFYYSYWIGDYTAEKIKLPSIEILEKVKTQAEFDEIQQFIDEKRGGDNIPSRVRDQLNSENVYGERWHKRLLIAIEYLMSTPQKIERIDPGSDLHREHVLPKKFESAKNSYSYWGENFEDIEAAQLKNSLGNLVPLQYDLNSAAAQKPFQDKVDIYEGETDWEKSSFDLTLRAASKYPDWTPEAVEENKRFLLKRSADLLRLPVEELLEVQESPA